MLAGTLLLAVALVVGLYAAWNIGANDVANAMGTSVGSKALSIKQAVIVAAIFEFAGAFLVGGSVSNTVRKGIADPLLFQDNPNEFAIGMLCALMASALWLQFASWKGLPVSTTHAIVGAVIGFAVMAHGVSAVDWSKVLRIVGSWFFSPLVGATFGLIIFSLIRRLVLRAVHPIRAVKRVGPFLIFLLGFVLSLIFLLKGLKNMSLGLSLFQIVLLGAVCSALLAIGSVFFLRRVPDDLNADQKHQLGVVERVFAWLQIVSACFMAFAHGSNDVANAVGPLAAIVEITRTGVVAVKSTVPIWLLGLGGLGIVIGLATYGARVIATIGSKLTEMTPSRGFAAEFGAATTVLIGSQMGLPLSTTHVLVGSVIGVGFAQGAGKVNLKVLRDVGISWVLTVPVAALISMVLFAIMR